MFRQGIVRIYQTNTLLFLLYFSDRKPETLGPLRMSRNETKDAFAQGRVVESIEPARFENRPDFKNIGSARAGRRLGSWSREGRDLRKLMLPKAGWSCGNAAKRRRSKYEFQLATPVGKNLIAVLST